MELHQDEIELLAISRTVPERVMLDGRDEYGRYEVRGCISRALYYHSDKSIGAISWASGYNAALERFGRR